MIITQYVCSINLPLYHYKLSTNIIRTVATQFLTHLFDKIFEKNPKIAKNNKNPKKYVFYIFASFLAFSTSSKKEFKFSKVFGTRSTFHTSFLKSLIFLIESTLILLVFKKLQKNKKNQNLQKKKVEGPILKPEQNFTYKYGLKTQRRGGHFVIWERQHKKGKP